MQAFKSKSYVRGATNLALGCLVALAKKETRYTALNGKKKKKKKEREVVWEKDCIERE